ncbi:MAG TPA: hypothetical protein VKS03_11480 [Thermoanaerobaculia bacterium]|nr:hypothetical protein [Thermoanaerobaculia bacterium]
MALPMVGIAVLITGVTLVMFGVVGAGFHRQARAVASPGLRDGAVRLVGPLLAAWWLAALLLATGGFFAAGRPGAPRIAWASVPLIVGLTLYAASAAYRRTIDGTPPDRLIGAQVYRLLGGVFVVGWALGLLPGIFALPAGLGDLAIGAAAPLVASLLRKRRPQARRAAVLWNVVGLADLVMAVTLGVLSTPGRLQRLSFGAPNTAISAYPFVLVPTVLVPLSVLLHVFSLRGLWKSREKRGETDSLSINRHVPVFRPTGPQAASKAEAPRSKGVAGEDGGRPKPPSHGTRIA